MDLRYFIKKRIIISALKKKRAKGFSEQESELHKLPEDADEHINNSYYFGGNTLSGQSLVFRVAFRCNLSELFILYTENGHFYYLEKQEYGPSDNPLKLECIEPAKRWHAVFNGPLKDYSTGENLDVSFDVDFIARLPIFSSAYHGDLEGLAKPIAKQKWTKEFFQSISGGDMGMSSSLSKAEKLRQKKNNEQHHYEQTGRIAGSIKINGVESKIDIPASRDHSYGKRDWNYMNNHIWLMAQTEKGEALNFQLVNFPFANSIFVGYTDICNDGNACLLSFKNLVYQHNDGLGTDTIELDLKYNNGRTYHVKVRRDLNIVTPFDNGNYYFQEAIADFDIDGIKARGTLEYGFNKDQSRWEYFDE